MVTVFAVLGVTIPLCASALLSFHWWLLYRDANAKREDYEKLEQRLKHVEDVSRGVQMARLR